MITQQLLTALKAAHGGASDYRVPQILGVSKQNVSQWKNGVSAMSDEPAIKAARLLGLDPVTVLLDLHIEREKGHAASQVWREARERLTGSEGP